MPKSSQIDLTEWLPKVTGSVLGKYIKERCEGMKCPACGSESHPFIHAEGMNERAPMYIFREYDNLERAKGFYLLSCRDCAFMWKFDAQGIIQWLIEKAGSSQEAGEE